MTVRSILAGAGFACVFFHAAAGLARVWYVDAAGGSDGDGSEQAPFALIQSAAQRALPGDTVLIHGGVYRETVVVPRSGWRGAPIRFLAAPGECVVVSGADRLPLSWLPVNGQIYSATTSRRVSQLFVDGRMVVEARWPNTPAGSLVSMNRAVAKTGSTATTIVDPDLPAVDWTGALAVVLPGAGWVSQSARVVKSSPASHSLTLDREVRPLGLAVLELGPASSYYLTHDLAALDSPGEWYQDDRGRLYLWAPGGGTPALHDVEIKARDLAFDVSGRSYVEIRGVRVFGASLSLADATHVVVDDVHVRYVTHHLETNAGSTADDGIVISGASNSWTNGSVAYSSDSAFVLSGSNHLIANNTIHDIGYSMSAGSPIRMLEPSSGIRIEHNTITQAAGAGIVHSHLHGGEILYNEVTDTGLLLKDGGAIDAWNTDGQGTEIAYNHVRGYLTRFGAGIYLDDGCVGHVVHHNLIEQVRDVGIELKDANEIYNNTVIDAGLQAVKVDDPPPWFTGPSPGNLAAAKIFNNVSRPAASLFFGIDQNTTPPATFRAAVPADGTWRTVTVDFDDLELAFWSDYQERDPSAIKALHFSPGIVGDFDVWLDNVRLIPVAGGSEMLLDDFDDGDTHAASGDYWYWAAGANCTGCTPSTLSVSMNAPGVSGLAAHLNGSGSWEGWTSFGLAFPSGVDPTQFRGVAFDVRAIDTMRLQANGGIAQSGHNAECPLDDDGVVVDQCGIDQGTTLPPYTDGYVGSAPDLGAFETGVARWVAGATTPAWDACIDPPSGTPIKWLSMPVLDHGQMATAGVFTPPSAVSCSLLCARRGRRSAELLVLAFALVLGCRRRFSGRA